MAGNRRFDHDTQDGQGRYVAARLHNGRVQGMEGNNERCKGVIEGHIPRGKLIRREGTHGAGRQRTPCKRQIARHSHRLQRRPFAGLSTTASSAGYIYRGFMANHGARRQRLVIRGKMRSRQRSGTTRRVCAIEAARRRWTQAHGRLAAPI